MNVIKIKDAINSSRCIIRDDGQKIYDEIHEKLKNKESITLDFEGIQQYSSPFFNYAIGKLLHDIDPEIVNSKLTITNINDTGQMIVDSVKENALRYHEDINYGEIVNAILEQQEKED